MTGVIIIWDGLFCVVIFWREREAAGAAGRRTRRHQENEIKEDRSCTYRAFGSGVEKTSFLFSPALDLILLRSVLPFSILPKKVSFPGSKEPGWR